MKIFFERCNISNKKQKIDYLIRNFYIEDNLSSLIHFSNIEKNKRIHFCKKVINIKACGGIVFYFHYYLREKQDIYNLFIFVSLRKEGFK